jgi:hypothetical protein
MVRVEAPRLPDGPTAEAASSGAELLPRWDLSDLYDGVDSPDLARDLEEAKRTIGGAVRRRPRGGAGAL